MENGKKTNGFLNMSGEEIVISGISGAFPSSDSVLEFGENLWNKVDMICDEPRWNSKDPDIPKHVGKISGIDKFDAQFFKVGYQQAKILEPISRKILEHAYGAIFDSGNTQVSLAGKKIGVFVGTAYTDYCTLVFYDIKHRSDFVVGGSSKSMFANRISYWVDGKGPSYTVDYSCASSAAALEMAYNSIKSGECDAAVVASGNICSHPQLSLNLRRAGLLCLDGKTKCFDENADGYVRSEAVSVLFLQKAEDAKRIYAEIVHAKGIYDLKPDSQFLPARKADDIQRFLKDFYSETDIKPDDVEYVEASGAAIIEADENEINAIGEIFASKKPVKIGCVKSNMGHSEAVSMLSGVTKMCLAYQKGLIPANLHYENPLDVSAVSEGRIQVVTDHVRFNRGLAALNNFSYTGANYHIVLKGHYKKKNCNMYDCQIPRIVLASGREESCVNKIFESLKSKPIDAEEIALLHDIFENDIQGHTGRGYTLLDNNQGKTESLSETVDYYSGVRKPLWFVFSGMGSQWTAMGADLMRIPAFARAIERCHKVLEPKGVDIVKIISSPDKTIFDNNLNAFVGIGAVQIGLTDILREMGVEPDYIIGHSLGEMACAYHDNTFTAEELILATYSRGKAVLETSLVKGSMAAVGVGYKALVNQCPPEIDIGCHNSSESCTISGPVEVMKNFVAELTQQGIFAREVPSGNIAYHSRHVANAGPALMESLRKVIKHPKLRSKKWLSTSVPKEDWDSEAARYSSPEYHKNNLIRPVLFEEVITMIPSNAVVVEIAPHGLLQAILKRSHPECTHIPLTRRGCQDGVKFLLDAIGKLYQVGYNPKVSVLYPKMEYPVSTETPLLSHLVQWEHSETWPLLEVESSNKVKIPSRNLAISLHDDDYTYIGNNIINGETKIPEAALLVYVWETIAMYQEKEYRNMSIVFKDIQFHSEVIVKPDTIVKLSIMVNKGSDTFEVCQDDSLIVTGIASGIRNVQFHNDIKYQGDDFDDICLNHEDVYKILRMRGYSYKDSLKSIHSVNINSNNAFVQWNNSWICFLDSLIQLNTLTRNFNGISKPKFIKMLRVSVLEQEKIKGFPVDGKECHVVQMNTILGITRCAGVEIDNITYVDNPAVYKEPDILKERAFYPFFATEEVPIKNALEINLQVIAENTSSKYLRIITSVLSKQCDIFRNIKHIAEGLPGVNISVINHVEDNFVMEENKSHVLILENFLNDSSKWKEVQRVISTEDFILTLESHVPMNNGVKAYFNILTCMSNGKQSMVLLRKVQVNDVVCFPIKDDNNFSWVKRIYEELVLTKRIVLVSEKHQTDGLTGFVTKLKRDGYKNIGLIAIHDFYAQPFNVNTEFYKAQLEQNTCINILKKGQWGGFYYTSCAKSICLRNFTLKSSIPGDVDKLSWAEAPTYSAQKILVQVMYSGLSINDCQKAANILDNDEGGFGMDFSGIDNNGDRVMGIIAKGAISSTVEADVDLLWPVPDHWSLEDAATVPLPYVHAYYCLAVRKQLMRKQRVLVIGGAGALGQAIISLCLAIDCTVFTTVSEIRKKEFLKALFPQLNENNISYHDDLRTVVMTNTQKQGCTFVINCATGSIREEAMKCVGSSGIFLDVSKHDMVENKNVGMSFLSGERHYNAICLSNIFRPEYESEKKILQKSISEGIKRGIVKPLTRVVYPPQMVSRAFRFLSMRKNRGRVLLRLRDPTIMKQGLNVLPRLEYKEDDVAIIICDEQGLGVELATRLVERGARKFLLHMQPSLINGYVHSKFTSWSKHEVFVKVSSENLHIEQGCADLMRNAMKFGKVKGVFIVHDEKRDGNEDKSDFINAYNKKRSVVLNLDVVSRNCPELSHFTVVSRSAQSASEEYALSLLDRVCELRNEVGLLALVIRYESLAEFEEQHSSSSKLRPQSLSTLFNTLEISLKMNYNNVVTFDLKERREDFIQKVSGILGVRDTQKLENETTLQSLDLNEMALKELSAAIKNFYQIDYPIEKIRRMSIRSLKEINRMSSTVKTDFEGGMYTFFKRIDTEEDYLSQRPIVTMPTLLSCSNEETIDPDSTYLIMIPGFEGRCETLKTVAERLKIQAVGVQLGPDVEGNSIQEIAQNIRKLITSTFTVKSTFYILGYSFGVNVALELAAILEKEGHIGIIFCLDSSPDAIRINLEAYLGNITDENLQNTVLKHIFHLMTEHTNNNLDVDFKDYHSFEDKLQYTLKKLKETISYSEQYERFLIEMAYKRIKLAKEYRPDMLLKSELILLKGITHPKANLTEDFNLSQYTEKPIKTFYLESDHGLAHQDTRVSNIINKCLEKKILQEFNSKSLCNVSDT